MSRRSFVNSVYTPDEKTPPPKPIRANIWTTAATLAETRAMTRPQEAEFWKRLAGSLRKAGSM